MAAPLDALSRITLLPEQRAAVSFLIDHPFAGIWVDIGGSKTLATLYALTAIQPAGHILVVAPKAITRNTWANEIEKWGVPVRYRSLITGPRGGLISDASRRHKLYEQIPGSPPTMWFINQDLVEDLVRHTARVVRRSGRRELTWPFSTLIIDESQCFAHHDSKRFEALKMVRDYCPDLTRVIELTGTPAPNGLHDLWSQLYLLDRGKALGGSITAFRDRYFSERLIPGTSISKYVPVSGADEQIYAAIDHLVLSRHNLSLDLPDPVVKDISVELDPDLVARYQGFKKSMVLDIIEEADRIATAERVSAYLASGDPEAKALAERVRAAGPDEAEAIRSELGRSLATEADSRTINTVVAANRAVLTSKLLQFSSGTLYTSDPDLPDTRGDYEVIHTAKLDALVELLKTVDDNVLLAYNFISDKMEIAARLEQEGIGLEVFDGSPAQVERWNEGGIRVLLLHPASAGPGLNLQRGGATIIWYTLPFRLDFYQQLNGRLHRNGQTRQVSIYRLLTTGTYDERMPGVLEDKRVVQDDLRRAVAGARAFSGEAARSLQDELSRAIKDLRPDRPVPLVLAS